MSYKLCISGKWWYYKLISEKNNEDEDNENNSSPNDSQENSPKISPTSSPTKNKMKGMLDDIPKSHLQGKMIVCLITQQNVRLFTFFSNYIEFVKYIKTLAPAKRDIYEVILGNFSQKPHFDIDLSYDDIKRDINPINMELFSKDVFDCAIASIIKILNDSNIDIDISRDILVYTSHGAHKKSIHIVVNNYCHANNVHAKNFYKLVYNNFINIFPMNKYNCIAAENRSLSINISTNTPNAIIDHSKYTTSPKNIPVIIDDNNNFDDDSDGCGYYNEDNHDDNIKNDGAKDTKNDDTEDTKNDDTKDIKNEDIKGNKDDVDNEDNGENSNIKKEDKIEWGVEPLCIDFSKIMDRAVYSKTQQFRLLGCEKFKSGRPKTFNTQWQYFDKTVTYSYVEEILSPNHEYMLQLEASLLSNTNSCNILPSFADGSETNDFFKKSRKYERQDDINPKVAKQAVRMLAEKGGITVDNRRFPYKFDRIVGALVLLRRLKPSWCSMCERTHEHENPFLVITGEGQLKNIYFHCRRASPGKTIFIGQVVDTENEIKVDTENVDDDDIIADSDSEIIYSESASESVIERLESLANADSETMSKNNKTKLPLNSKIDDEYAKKIAAKHLTNMANKRKTLN